MARPLEGVSATPYELMEEYFSHLNIDSQSDISYGLRIFGSGTGEGCQQGVTKLTLYPEPGNRSAFLAEVRTAVSNPVTSAKADLLGALEAVLVDMRGFNVRHRGYGSVILMTSGRNYCDQISGIEWIASYASLFEQLADAKLTPELLIFSPNDSDLCRSLRSRGIRCHVISRAEDLRDINIQGFDIDPTLHIGNEGIQFDAIPGSQISEMINEIEERIDPEFLDPENDQFWSVYHYLSGANASDLGLKADISYVKGKDIMFIADLDNETYIFHHQNINQLSLMDFLSLYRGLELDRRSMGTVIAGEGTTGAMLQALDLEIGDFLIALNGKPLTSHLTLLELAAFYDYNYAELIYVDAREGVLKSKKFYVW